MSDSILLSTKEALGLAADDTSFDPQICMYINTALSTLSQLGLGPAEGFMIEDGSAMWVTLLNGDPRLNLVQTYVYLQTRMLFDPPTIGFLATAMENQIQQLCWRINVICEEINAEAAATESAFVWEISDAEGFPADANVGDVGFDPDSGDVWRLV